MSNDKPDAWMPLYIGDWDGDTADLSCEEDGAYGRLVRSYWRKGPPKDDDLTLSRIVRMDLRAWKKLRPTLAAFFQIGEGVWRHKRVDAELVRWSDKKAAASAKAQAAAEKRWGKKDASSIARSIAEPMLGAMPEQCPSSSSTEEEDPNRSSSLRGRQDDAAHADGAPPPCAWGGPESVRQAFAAALGEPWCEKYLYGCRWQDVPDRAILVDHPIIGKRIVKDASAVLRAEGLAILERAA